MKTPPLFSDEEWSALLPAKRELADAREEIARLQAEGAAFANHYARLCERLQAVGVHIGDGSHHDLAQGVEAEIARLRTALAELGPREHTRKCDLWPQQKPTGNPSSDRRTFFSCTCGADEHNAQVAAAEGES